MPGACVTRPIHYNMGAIDTDTWHVAQSVGYTTCMRTTEP